jgi:hypothetical protein
MSIDEEVKDIVAQLQRLQIRQTALITRLEEISETQNKNDNATQEFAIGDRVRIKNPRVLQANKGKITRIGESRITVTTTNGTKIVRAPKNLAFD